MVWVCAGRAAKSVTAAARRYLAELERERDALRRPLSPQTEFDLGTGAAPAAQNPALAALRAADPDVLSPREALDVLYRLKRLDPGP